MYLFIIFSLFLNQSPESHLSGENVKVVVHLTKNVGNMPRITSDDEQVTIYDFNLALRALREYGLMVSELRIEYQPSFKHYADQLAYHADLFCNNLSKLDVVSIEENVLLP